MWKASQALLGMWSVLRMECLNPSQIERAIQKIEFLARVQKTIVHPGVRYLILTLPYCFHQFFIIHCRLEGVQSKYYFSFLVVWLFSYHVFKFLHFNDHFSFSSYICLVLCSGLWKPQGDYEWYLAQYSIYFLGAVLYYIQWVAYLVSFLSESLYGSLWNLRFRLQRPSKVL